MPRVGLILKTFP